VPFLQPIFNTITIDAGHWLMMLPLILLPSIAAEVMKAVQFKQITKANAN
jgi:hypothetical protein